MKNVILGQDISTSELRKAYNAVVLAYGAAKDKSLGIPGESSQNVISARNFVGFYNGLPEDKNLEFSLDTDHVAIIGLGNVAIDVARVLTTPIDELVKTDITEAAIEKLLKSRVEKVSIIGKFCKGILNLKQHKRRVIKTAGCLLCRKKALSRNLRISKGCEIGIFSAE